MVQAFKKKFKNEKGFTLIELLAVIVILGIIAAIAVPSIMGIINKSKSDATVAEAIQIIDAAKLSHASHSNATKWKDADDSANSIVGLGSSLENVQDKNYEVDLSSSNVYSITNHAVCTILGANKAKTDSVTESQLLNYSK
jgi:type IV pilus assembly protein PilA